MSERTRQIDTFLAAHGWGGPRFERGERRPIAGDASFRRYQRLTNGHGRSVVLMDAPPPQENIRPFTVLARHLASLGLSAPRVYAADEGTGLLLLEDFGDDNMGPLVDDPRKDEREKQRLYILAIDTLIALHRDPRTLPAPAPPFGEERILREVGLVLDWYWPAVTGAAVAEPHREDYFTAWRQALPQARRVPETLVLFDFFPDNLMFLEGRDGIAACGLLDFQDAVIGPLTYDLVSLLEDARRDVPADLQSALLERYLSAFPAINREDFAASYAVMGAQRNARILGVFTRLCVRDRKPGYLRHIPRVWRLIEQDVRHPALAPVEAWLDRHIPPALRRVPPAGRSPSAGEGPFPEIAP